MTQYYIERFHDDQAQALTELLNNSYSQLADRGLNYTAASQGVAKTLERIAKGRCFVLKNNNDEIVGTILLTIENVFTGRHTAYIGQFAIHPDYQKLGLGARLLSYCESLARAEGFEGVQLDTAIPADHLVRWYQKRDYKIVGQVHFEGKTYDSYVFEKLF